MQLLVPLVFHNLPSLYPPSFTCPKWRRSLLIRAETRDYHSRDVGWEKNDRFTPLTIVDQFGIKISSFTPSFEALGRLLKKKNMMTKIRISHISRVERRRYSYG